MHCVSRRASLSTRSLVPLIANCNYVSSGAEDARKFRKMRYKFGDRTKEERQQETLSGDSREALLGAVAESNERSRDGKSEGSKNTWRGG